MKKVFLSGFIFFACLTSVSCQVKLASNLGAGVVSSAVPTINPSQIAVVQSETLGQLDFRRILSGNRSNIRSYETRVIDNESDFIKLWDDHTGSKTNPLFVPKIDFQLKNVVAVFLGERPTTGFSVEVNNIEETKDNINISLKENKPLAGSEIKAEITQPFIIIETKKSTKKFVIENSLINSSVNEEMKFTNLETGYDSGIKDFSRRIAKTEKEFSDLYREHLSSQKTVNATVFPKIDFKNQMVAVIFLGERPSSGYNIEIKNIIKTDSQIVVEASETSPTPETAISSIITTPYQFVTLPQSDLPVKFDINLIVPKYEQVTGNVNGNVSKNLVVKNFLSGENSNIKSSQFLLVQTRDDFRSLWAQHSGSVSAVIPEVDFGNNSLIAVFSGTKQSSGFNISVTSAVESANDLRIFVDLSKDRSVSRNVVTSPFSMVLIPKSFKSPSFIINNLNEN